MAAPPPSLEELESRLAAATSNILQLHEAFSIAKAALQDANTVQAAEVVNSELEFEVTTRQTQDQQRPPLRHKPGTASNRRRSSTQATPTLNQGPQKAVRKRNREFDGKNSSSAGNRITRSYRLPREVPKHDVVGDTDVVEPPRNESEPPTSCEIDSSYGISEGRVDGKGGSAKQRLDVAGDSDLNAGTHSCRPVSTSLPPSMQINSRSSQTWHCIEWAGTQRDLEVGIANATQAEEIQRSAGIDEDSVEQAQLQLLQHYREKVEHGREMIHARWLEQVQADMLLPEPKTQLPESKKRKLSPAPKEAMDATTKKQKTDNEDVVVIDA